MARKHWYNTQKLPNINNRLRLKRDSLAFLGQLHLPVTPHQQNRIHLTHLNRVPHIFHTHVVDLLRYIVYYYETIQFLINLSNILMEYMWQTFADIYIAIFKDLVVKKMNSSYRVHTGNSRL